jgi:hypothetical protein
MAALKGMRIADIAIIALCLAVFAASVAMTGSSRGGEPSLVITSDEGRFVYPLSKDEDLRVEGPLGWTEVSIASGTARIEDSPCDNKLCLAMSPIGKDGQWISCLPNRVFLRVESAGEKDGLDAATY